MHTLSHNFENQSILITGGTGSFGQMMARHLLSTKVRRIIILSRDECKQWHMQQQSHFQDPRIRFFLGDIRDKERLKVAFRNLDAVIHAAALKQVPAAEYNPTEFIKTNVLGTMNVVESAIEARVARVVFLSTDKAASPINLYGATKLCAEKLALAAGVYSDPENPTRLSCVRYGNVMMSRGSVIELWQDLIRAQATELPLTHPEMTRFWITLEQAVAFVHAALQDMQGGEIFIPRIPSMKLKDLAAVMAPTLGLKITGIRHGEKLHEVLVNTHEAVQAFAEANRFVIVPDMQGADYFVSTKRWWAQKAQALNDPNFCFASNQNCDYLSSEQMRGLLANLSKAQARV